MPHDPSLPPDDFKRVFRGYPGGVTVITADSGAGPVALTATSLASVSADPPLIVFSVSALSSSLRTFSQADTVVIHMIGPSKLELAVLAATRGADRFADRSSWTRLPTGEPLYLGVDTWVRARIEHRLDVGNSKLIVVRALQAGFAAPDVEPADEALVHHNRTWHRIGAHSRIDDWTPPGNTRA
jgi:flavin reductase (DIM6/NTAB) family NADH-FMN oxidoreductase RutF